MQAYENGKKFRVTNKWSEDLGDAVEAVGHKYYGFSKTGKIESLTDWTALMEVVAIYEKFFPQEVVDYLELNTAIRNNQKNKYGLMEDPTTKKGGMINARALGNIPFHLDLLIRVVWPVHKFDRKFNEKFFKTFKRYATAERI